MCCALKHAGRAMLPQAPDFLGGQHASQRRLWHWRLHVLRSEARCARGAAPGAKLFYLSGLRNGKYLRREVLNLARFISVMKFRPLSW